MNEDLTKYNNIIVQSSDPRLNFTFMKKDDIVNFNNQPDILDTGCLDYGVKVGEADGSNLSKTIPLSYIDLKTVEEGEEWFKNKYPNLPEEYWSIMSKYYLKEPFTKKSLKNDLKKLKKKGTNKNLQGLKILKGNFKIDFN